MRPLSPGGTAQSDPLHLCPAGPGGLPAQRLAQWLQPDSLGTGSVWSFQAPAAPLLLLPLTQVLLEKAIAPYSSTLAWRIPWTEEPGRLQSMGSLGVGHDWATSLSLFTFHFSLSCTGEGNGNPLQCSCLENPRDGEAWWAAVYGVTQSRTRLSD